MGEEISTRSEEKQMRMGLGKRGLALFALIIPACSNIEEQGECLEWYTTVIEKKERLPYPMQGVVVREETVVQCRSRDERQTTESSAS
jgi:NAD-dependent DNA ligase